MLWQLLGSEHGCLLSSKITSVMWHQLRLLFLQLHELNQEHPHGWLQFVRGLHTEIVLIRAEHGSELCPWAPWPPVGLAVAPHWMQAGHCMASSSSVQCAGWGTGGLAEGYQNLLKATSSFHRGWRRRELSSSHLSVVSGRHFCAAGTRNGKFRTLGIACAPGPGGQSHSLCCSVGHWAVMEKSTTMS